MTEEIYAGASTDELYEEFVRLARVTRGGRTGAVQRTPERAVLVGNLKSIAAELRDRKPMPHVIRLFDHDDTDVRTWASGQLGSLDQEWACAAACGITAKLPTREVVALCRHAQNPPEMPPLNTMSDFQLKARFEDAATRQYATKFMGEGWEPFDVETYNNAADEILLLKNELNRRNRLGVLAPLMSHANPIVRRDAAHACSKIAPNEALAVLEEISRDTNVDIGGSARRAIHWPALGS